MNSIILILFVWMISMILCVSHHKKSKNGDHRFEGVIRCSACQALVSELSSKMKEGENNTETFIASHRLDKRNRQRRQLYRDSEVRAIEWLEEICSTVSREYHLRQNSSSYYRRMFTKNTSMHVVDYYSPEEKEQLSNVKKDLEWTCNLLVDEFNDELISAIKKQFSAPEIEKILCEDGSKVCELSALQPFIDADQASRKKWLKAKKKRRLEKKKKQEDERIKKEEEDRIKNEEKEKLERERTNQVVEEEEEEEVKVNGAIDPTSLESAVAEEQQIPPVIEQHQQKNDPSVLQEL